MARHIGIVACSAEGAALCYRTICAEARPLLGEHAHPEIALHGHSFAEYVKCIRSGDWDGVASLMLSSTRKVAGAGAEFAICPDNTIHQAFDRVAAESPVPWLHIAEVVGAEARAMGLGRVGVLGTRYLMEGPVYPRALEKFHLSCVAPGEEARRKIDGIIFKELVYGVFREEARLYFNGVTAELARQGCEAVVLGCTEIPLLVREDDCPLPTLDSTRLLARAALAFSQKGARHPIVGDL